MIGSFHNSSTALRAYAKAFDYNAYNVANINTPAFKPVSTTFSSLSHQGGVKLNPVRTESGAGYLIHTGNNLDFAIKGKGYFKVTEADGSVSHTRAGNFSKDGSGNLVTAKGGKVASHAVVDEKFEVSKNGEIYSDGAYKGRIDVVDKEGNLIPADQFSLEQGFLEASSVDLAREIIDGMVDLNSYKANMTSLQTADTLLGTIIDMTA